MRIKASVGRNGKNFHRDVKLIQELINRTIPTPLRLLIVDGIIGPSTINAIMKFQLVVAGIKRPDGLIEPNGKTWIHLARYAIDAPALKKGLFKVHEIITSEPKANKIHPAHSTSASAESIAWGRKVSANFKIKTIKIAQNLGVSPDYLMACMAFETGEKFSPSIKNGAGSGATGLIQFMPSTAKSLGTSVEKLAEMTAEEQLDFVEKYFKPHKGKLKTLEDVYLAILYPAAIGKSTDHELFKSGTKVYEQNSGFDANKDGVITPAEISVKVRAKYDKGLTKPYFG